MPSMLVVKIVIAYFYLIATFTERLQIFDISVALYANVRV